MTDYQSYVFILCLIVFSMFTIMAVVCLTIIMRLQLRLIKDGSLDVEILEEYVEKYNNNENRTVGKILGYVFSGIVCLGFIALFLTSLFISKSEHDPIVDLPVYRVVRTSSMAEKNEENTYLFENNLDDQIQVFDLIRTEKIPDEMDLELYDIVVYETDGMLIVHRIVEIEEPNESHPDCRYFRLQGDAVESPDRFPVEYEQMRAIYRGERIPFIGSFIIFMQSPAGWLCVLLTIIAMIATPILEAIIAHSKRERLTGYYTVKKWIR